MSEVMSEVINRPCKHEELVWLKSIGCEECGVLMDDLRIATLEARVVELEAAMEKLTDTNTYGAATSDIAYEAMLVKRVK